MKTFLLAALVCALITCPALAQDDELESPFQAPEGADGLSQRLSPGAKRGTQLPEGVVERPKIVIGELLGEGGQAVGTPAAKHSCDARRAAAQRDLLRLERFLAHELGVSLEAPVRHESLPEPQAGRALALTSMARSWLRQDHDPDWDAVDATLDSAWTEGLEAVRIYGATLTQRRGERAVGRLTREVARGVAVGTLEPAKRAGFEEHPAFERLNQSLARLGDLLEQRPDDLTAISRELNDVVAASARLSATAASQDSSRGSTYFLVATVSHSLAANVREPAKAAGLEGHPDYAGLERALERLGRAFYDRAEDGELMEALSNAVSAGTTLSATLERESARAE